MRLIEMTKSSLELQNVNLWLEHSAKLLHITTSEFRLEAQSGICQPRSKIFVMILYIAFDCKFGLTHLTTCVEQR